MPSVNTAKVLRWTGAEYLTVAKAMGPLLREGLTLQEASLKAVEVIPLARRYSRATLTCSHSQGALRKAIVKNGIATEAELAKAQAASRFGKVRWTDREWALITRRVRHWRDDLHDKRPTAKQILAAAQIELPADRQRNFNSIQATSNPILEKSLKAAWAKQDMLAALPFDALRKKFDEALAPPPASKPTSKPPAIKTPSKAISSPQAAPKPSARTQAIQTPPETPQAPQTFQTPQQSQQPAQTSAELPLFVINAGPGFDAHIRSIVLDVVKAELATAFAQGIHDVTGQLSAQLQSGMASMLNQFLEAKPGDVIAAPPPPVQVDTGKPVDAHQVLLPQLDVVGLIGPQVTVVKNALNGHASRVRFIEADHVGSWTPRSVVVMNTKFVSHNAEFKCKKAGVKPIRVSGGADVVIQALNRLHQQQVQLAGVESAAPH